METDNKTLAHAFFKTLEKALNKRLRKPAEMKNWLQQTVTAAKTDERQGHLRNAEAAFLNGEVIPVLFDTMLNGPWAVTKEQAQDALLNEYFKYMPQFSKGSPSRSQSHPFEKKIGARATDVYKRWAGRSKGGALRQACPDFGLARPPFPVSAVFEGKYFASGSREAAERELATNIYQAYFYRSLPDVPATKRRPPWRYDYACLLAYDATRDGTLRSAWNDLDVKVRDNFWSGANVFVMILGGAEQ